MIHNNKHEPSAGILYQNKALTFCDRDHTQSLLIYIYRYKYKTIENCLRHFLPTYTHTAFYLHTQLDIGITANRNTLKITPIYEKKVASFFLRLPHQGLTGVIAIRHCATTVGTQQHIVLPAPSESNP